VNTCATRRALTVLGCILLLAGLSGLDTPASGMQVDVNVQYTGEQRHAVAEFGAVLGVAENMYENPPLCMRMKADGEIIAEVFGKDQVKRVERAFRAIDVKAKIRVTTIAAYNAQIRALERKVAASRPSRFVNVSVGYLQIETLGRGVIDLDFEPQCPTVTVDKPTLKAQGGKLAEEDRWADRTQQHYGTDLVQWWCCGVTHRRKLAPKARAPAAKPGARFHEQRRAKRELRGALHPDEHLPPPVCMRFPPRGPRIVAVVLGRQNLPRVKAAFKKLRLKAVYQLSSLRSYEAHLARLYRQIHRVNPRSYTDLHVEWSGFGFAKPLQPGEDISFQPLCPRAQIGIYYRGIEPTDAERAWAEANVRSYGSDWVSIFYGGYGHAD
jgi:hypothetical protein